MKIKNILILFLSSLLLTQCSPKVSEPLIETPVVKQNVELWRSTAPSAGQARKVEMGEYNVFDMSNGLKVIVVENHKLPRVSYQVSLNTDPIVEGDQAGYIGFTGQILSRGTQNMTKSEIDKAVDQIGASMSSSAGGVFGSSLTKHQDKLLSVMSEVLLNPSFPEEEFKKIKTQALSGIQQSKDDPNTIASNIARKVNYGEGHPYAEVETEETLNRVELKKCKNYYDTYFKPNNAYLIIVGDITLGEAKSKAQKYFGNWESGLVKSHKQPESIKLDKTNVSFANKDGAVQSVVRITYPVDIKPGSQEELDASVMNAILGGGVFLGRLMQNLREDKAFTYGARSSIQSDKLIGSFNASASVRNEVTDSSIVEFLYEMDRIVNEPVSEEDLRLSKNSMAGAFARSLESPQTLARYARNIVKYDLPEDHYATYLERLEEVTVSDVQATAQKYIRPDKANIVVVGSKDDIADRLVRFDADGELDYYDAYGNLLVIEEEEIPSDITPEVIVNKYLNKIGGAAKLKQVNSVESHYTMSMMGMDMEVDIYQKAGKGLMKIGGAGQVFQQQIFDGKTAYEKHTGGASKYVKGDPKYDDIKSMAEMFSHLDYLDGNYKMEIKGLDQINGESCYKLAVVSPAGTKSTEYFSTQSGLLLRTLSVQEVDNADPVIITQDYSDYQEIDGILFPGKISMSGVGPMPFATILKEIEVNKPIDDKLFIIE